MKFIGDIVLTTPLIRTLRETYPHASISYLGERHAVSLLEHHPMLDEIIALDLQNQTFGAQLSLYKRLHASKFDCVIDLFSNPRSALLCYATRAPIRVGADRRGRGRLYTTRIKDDGKPKSAIAFHYQSLEALGIAPRSYKTELFLTDREKEQAREYLSAHGAPASATVIALQCGGTWPAKLWDKDRFAELALLCQKEFGASIVLTGGMNDREIVAHVKSRVPGAIDAVGLPLRQAAALLGASSAMVSNDCGAMHIAVAVGTPTIGIFGPGEENIWFPYTKEHYGEASPHRALRRDVPCHPCHLDYCTRTGDGYMECMRLLTTREVFDVLKEIVH
ncbi:MAG: glycosyltransferase family 9 protein [Acidobacteriota bacterium]